MHHTSTCTHIHRIHPHTSTYIYKHLHTSTCITSTTDTQLHHIHLPAPHRSKCTTDTHLHHINPDALHAPTNIHIQAKTSHTSTYIHKHSHDKDITYIHKHSHAPHTSHTPLTTDKYHLQTMNFNTIYTRHLTMIP